MRHTTPWTDLLLGLCVLGAGVMFVAFGPTGGAGLGGAARLAFGLLGLLLVPGYAAAAALFPGRRDIDPVSRGALALGLSVAAVPLMASLLNQTPWGIRPLPMALALLILTALLSGVAVIRRQRAISTSSRQSDSRQSDTVISPQDQSARDQSTKTTQLRPVHSKTTQVWTTRIDVDATQNRATQGWDSLASTPQIGRPQPHTVQPRYARTLLLALLAVTVATGVVGGFTIQQRSQESFTEFYALGSTGKLSSYPYRVQPGQPFEVTLGVLNRERLPARYSVRTSGCSTLASAPGSSAEVPNLEPGQEWRGRLRCSVGAGTTALQFVLVRGGSLEPYRTLTLRVQPTAPTN